MENCQAEFILYKGNLLRKTQATPPESSPGVLSRGVRMTDRGRRGKNFEGSLILIVAACLQTTACVHQNRRVYCELVLDNRQTVLTTDLYLQLTILVQSAKTMSFLNLTGLTEILSIRKQFRLHCHCQSTKECLTYVTK